jgi:DHA1 family bicyclomycin/chloramphenicol resistance-like MFS transporter
MRFKNIRAFEFIALMSFTMSLVAVSIDAVLPALPAIALELGFITLQHSQMVVSLCVLGMVFGELLFGPLCDANGRRPALVLGVGVFCLGTTIAMGADNFEQMGLARVLQGLGAAGPKIVCRAVIRDRFEGAAMARMMSLIFTVFILVPMIAPMIGQGLLLAAGWRKIFGLYLFWAGIAGLWFMIRQPETLAQDQRVPLSLKRVCLNSGCIFKSRKVMAYTCASGMVFGTQLLFLATAQAVFSQIYHVGSMFAVYFAVLAASLGLATLINSRLVATCGMHKMVHYGAVGHISFAGLLFGASLVTDPGPTFVWFMVLQFMMHFCMGIVFGNLGALAMQPLGRIAGLGASVMAAVSSLIAVLFATLCGWFYDATLLPLALGYFAAGMATLQLLRIGHRASGDVVYPVNLSDAPVPN